MYPLEGEKVRTDVGDYSIVWTLDECPERPYSEGFTLLTHGNRNQIPVREGDTDSAVARRVMEALDSGTVSGAAIVRYLRLAGKRGVTQVDCDYSPVAADPTAGWRPYGVAWAPDDVPDWSADIYTHSMLAMWSRWADGDVFGYSVEDPSGVEIDSCWGFFGFAAERAYTRGEAMSAIQADVARRVEAANLVGAGFVGII